jgi:hypothetical protein
MLLSFIVEHRFGSIADAYTVPSAVDRWIAETLRSYTLLPTYPTDLDHFLRSHVNTLTGFFNYLTVLVAREEPSFATKLNYEKELHSIMKTAGDLVSQMSFSYRKFVIDWDYCDKKKEVFKHDFDTHDLCLLDNVELTRNHFHTLEEDEKVGDVVMFVRPPILGMDRISDGRIWGKPFIVIEPVKGYDPDPPRVKKMDLLDFMEQMDAYGKKEKSEVQIS